MGQIVLDGLDEMSNTPLIGALPQEGKMISHQIKNRWTGDVQFTAEIDCAEDAPLSVKIGLSVKWAIDNKSNLSGADLSGADLLYADLSGAVLCGADLSDANLSGVNLSDADLSYADLRYAVLRGADLSDANLSGVNLSDADLRGVNLSGADLSGVNLSDANLRGVNLRGADLSYADLRDANLGGVNLSGAPVIENIHQKIYAAASAPNALRMESWHTCETTHCRAGWAVTLAGDDGRELEKRIGTDAAGALIYIASDPTLERVPSWYATNEDALADMKRLAELEAARTNNV
jgi:uncharacterized protein YjbI with pentapeptide repeats